MVVDSKFTSDYSGSLGFSNLPQQVHRKSVKKGFEFTLMTVGESGLGKTTFINSLLSTNIYKDRVKPRVKDTLNKSIEIVSNTVDIEEKGVKLKITVIDTPGFGDAIDLKEENIMDPIVSYIDEQYEKYLSYETSLNRRNIIDTRIHCCFYFISPLGYGLKPIDILAMKQLHTRVNLIPIIAKADGLTPIELQNMKRQIIKDIEANDIKVYTVPDCDSDEEEEYKASINRMKDCFPFAISSSFEKTESKGRQVFGRPYPWGIVETENPAHSDFLILKSLLITHMGDLREVTADVHYENYRAIALSKRGTDSLCLSDGKILNKLSNFEKMRE